MLLLALLELHVPTLTLYTAAPAMTTGKDSPQYKIVTENYEDIIDALEANNAAYKTVRRKVKAKEWLRATENPSEEELVTIIQNRIRRDTSDYDVFMDMLHNTDGMDQIVKKLQLPGRTISLYILLKRCHHINVLNTECMI